MRRTLVHAVAGVAMVFALVTACGSEDSGDSGGDTNATADTAAGADGTGETGEGGGTGANEGAGGDDASQKVSAAIEQAMGTAPVTFTPKSAELSESAKGSLETIAQAMQDNDVRIKVATSAGYPDAAKSMTLSEQRAQAIVAAMEDLGVTKDRIDTEATGNENAQGAQALQTQITVA